MTDPSATHRLQRSLRKLAVDLVRDGDRRRTANADSQLREREEQIQFEVSGSATTTPIWMTVDFEFEQAFSKATDRRQSLLDRPQTWVGYEMGPIVDSLTQEPQLGGVILHAYVNSWLDDGLTITGANAIVCAYAPVGAFDFKALVHMTFQGYGIPRDPEPDMEM